MKWLRLGSGICAGWAAVLMLGHKPDIHEPDVWRAIGENLSRQPEKQSALEIRKGQEV